MDAGGPIAGIPTADARSAGASPIPPLVRVTQTPDGVVTTLVDLPAGHLPTVLRRDLDRAWAMARAAARSGLWGDARRFRFRAAEGGWIDLALADRDAGAWVAAVERGVGGLRTTYAVALCFRLLALIDLLGRASWARGLFRLDRDGATLDADLLDAAAATPLSSDGRFDDGAFRARLSRRAPALPGVARRC